MDNPTTGCLLVVDDDKVNRLLLGHYLVQQGHAVTYAENGRQALDILRTQPVEMVLLDIEMPEINGYQVLEQVIADPQLREIPIIVTSALEEMDSVVKCIEMGAEDYLTKPVNQVLLKARINASLDKKRLRDQRTRLLMRLEREMEIARKTQQSILPVHLPEHPGYDFGALMIPARAVGGDFYEFITLDRDRLGVVIGDVADKGLPAALIMALTYSLVSVDALQMNSPTETLINVNRHLLNVNASGMFVTLLYGILDCGTGHFRYARAGHLPPVVLKAHGQPVDIPVDRGQPLGLFEDIELDEQEFTIPPGGMALLFSDGLSEASDSLGDEFGDQRLSEVLSENQEKNAQAVCEQLWLAVQIHSGDAILQDDFTTMVLKRFDSHT
jgi:sigma-B regulation protein RsbU (phosphoserine phosphatase)